MEEEQGLINAERSYNGCACNLLRLVQGLCERAHAQLAGTACRCLPTAVAVRLSPGSILAANRA